MRHDLVLAALLLATNAQAAEITLPVPDAREVATSTVTYQCEDRSLTVRYVNAGPVSLAVFAVDDRTVVASNVLSASGARYAGAQYVWWTKGPEADLYDLMQGEDAPPLHCTSA